VGVLAQNHSPASRQISISGALTAQKKEKWRKMQKFKKISIALAICLLLVGGVFAVMYLDRTVTHNIQIVGRLIINLYTDSTYTVKLTSIDWGKIQRGETKEVIANIMNEGDINAYVFWSVADLPSGVTLQMRWEANSWDSKNLLTPREGKQLLFRLVVSLDAPMNSFSFVQTIRAEDEP